MSKTTDETKNKIIKLVETLSKKYTKPIPKSKLFEYDELKWGKNGIGDRWCRSIFNYTIYYKDNGYRTYSENDNENCNHVIKAYDIVSILPLSIRTNKTTRPISSKIKREIRQKPCVVCRSNNGIVCDHKNDFYNDKRVLNVKTQIIDDFQPLCNACNLKKRQVNKYEREMKQLYYYQDNSFTKLDFPWQLKTYDPNDINNKKDTFWYDIVEFQRKTKFYHKKIYPVLIQLKSEYSKIMKNKRIQNQ